jgi:hypothetical protein
MGEAVMGTLGRTEDYRDRGRAKSEVEGPVAVLVSEETSCVTPRRPNPILR